MKTKRYSVQAVARLTGLTPDTLRAWERRYGAVVPDREGKGRRAYSESDVERLQLLKYACDRGHAIRLVAPLNNQQLKELVENGEENRESLAASKDVVSRLLDMIDRFAMREFEHELGRAVISLELRRVIQEVLHPLLTVIGERWERNEFSIAQEHAVSASLRNFMGGIARTYPRRNGSNAVILTTLSGELHEFGVLMLCLMAMSEGFGCHYLGPNLPVTEIARVVRVTGSRIVGLSIVAPTDPHQVAGQLRELVGLLREFEAELWVGGPGSEKVMPLVDTLPVVHVPDLSDFERRLNLIRAR